MIIQTRVPGINLDFDWLRFILIALIPCKPNTTHHTRYFDLHAAVALHLRTTYGPAVNFVLVFFLPVDCKNLDDQKKVIKSLVAIIQKICGSLRIFADME